VLCQDAFSTIIRQSQFDATFDVTITAMVRKLVADCHRGIALGLASNRFTHMKVRAAVVTARPTTTNKLARQQMDFACMLVYADALMPACRLACDW